MYEARVVVEPHVDQLELRTLLNLYVSGSEIRRSVSISQLKRFTLTEGWQVEYRGRWAIVATASFCYEDREKRKWRFKYIDIHGHERIWVAQETDRLPRSFLFASFIVPRPPAVREENLY